MKLENLKNASFKPSLSIGTHEVIFERIEWIEDEHDEVTAYNIYFDGYAPIYNKFFDDLESNFALKAFMTQLNELNIGNINNHKGEKIIVEMKRSADGKYINANYRVKASSRYR